MSEETGSAFLFMRTYEVHSPLAPPELFRSRLVRECDGPLPQASLGSQAEDKMEAGRLHAADLRYLHDPYDAKVAYTDQCLGSSFDPSRALASTTTRSSSSPQITARTLASMTTWGTVNRSKHSDTELSTLRALDSAE